MRTTLRTAAAALVTAVMVAAGGRAGEEPLPLDKVPKEVLDAVKKRFPKAELVEAAKETDGDKVEYEVSLKDGGAKVDVMLSTDGKITLIEATIAAKDLPKAVTAMIEAKYPKATLTTVEEVTKVTDGKEVFDFYEVLLVTADKKTIELKLAVEVKITGTEDKTDEKEGGQEAGPETGAVVAVRTPPSTAGRAPDKPAGSPGRGGDELVLWALAP